MSAYKRRAVGLAATFLTCSTSALLASAFGASAQVPVTPPTREEVTRPNTPTPGDTTPRLTVEGDVGRGACALDRPEYQSLRFTLNQVVFEDLRGLDAEALRPAYAGMEGRDMPLAALCDIRDRAAQILSDAGYVAAIEVPEQRIADGTVRLKVVMARLTELRFHGDLGRSERLISGYLQPLTRQAVFNRLEAERYLLLANDLPGYSVRLALRPAGTVRGDVVGEVTVHRIGGVADFTAQNLGSREVGRWGLLAQGQAFDLTGMGDRTALAVFSTPDFEEQRTVQLAHEFRVGGEGLTLGGQVTYSWGQPDVAIPNFDIRSETLYASVEASYPFIRTQGSNLRGALGLDIADQDVDFNGIGLSRDRLRVVYGRLSADATDVPELGSAYSMAAPRWRVASWIEARRGIDGLGASEACGAGLINCFAPGVTPPSRLEGQPDAFVVRGQMNAEFRPAPRLTLALEARAQYSGDPLFSFEEFSAGAYTIGRGYDPGAIQGDSGAGVRAEVRFGDPVPRSRTDWAFEWFAFADRAWTRDKDILFIIPDADITSVGGGVRAAWGDRFRIEAMVAAPLDPLPLQTEEDNPRLLVTLSTRLWPWSVQ